MTDRHITLDRAGSDLLATTMQIEGISAGLRALASDIDGQRAVTDIQIVRALELLAGCCDAAVHRLGVVHDLIEAGDRQEGDDETPR